ncbi:hypothetical protein LAZ67_14001466 [Cordylochernes scorpioides]|uniref:RNA-directed DNA polymerase n=1 Tax=Cordylochernes scorpioides TaxID=51811 RepID=A0ABY6L6I0_9ARAC|nr:hypothetical protein LAZ67_14001466 [Cordylochernes scorpioides]
MRKGPGGEGQGRSWKSPSGMGLREIEKTLVVVAMGEGGRALVLNPNMSEEDRVGHLMKVVADDIYRILLTIEDLIGEIVKEEFQLIPNEQANSISSKSLEKEVLQRAEQSLSPIEKAPVVYSKKVLKNRRDKRQMGEATKRRKPDQFRMEDNIPICFYCNRPGHVAKYCWKRRSNYQEREPKMPNEDPSMARLYLVSDHIIPPKSIKRVVARTPNVAGIKNCVIEGSRKLLLEKELFIPSSYVTKWHGPANIWVTNFSKNQIPIPSGMCVAQFIKIQPQEICPIVEANENYVPKGVESTYKMSKLEENILSCISPELPPSHKIELLEHLVRFSELFNPITKSPSELITKHKIATGDARPLKRRPYRVSPSESKVIQEKVDRMMEIGVVHPSKSPWASPIVFIRKRDGSVRFCVDHRGLNKVTKKDVYPLPRVEDALDCLKGAKIYSTMDLKSRYWQISFDEADREKTAFITPDGLFEFKKVGLRLNPSKCYFGASKIKILEHQVDQNGIRPDDEKIKAITEFPAPNNLQQIALTSKPVMGHFDDDAPTELHTDASGYEIGAVLAQKQESDEKENDVSIVYKTGRMHQDADCLSRNPLKHTEENFNDDIPTLFLLSDISRDQENYPYIAEIIRNISQPLLNTQDDEFKIVKGIHYRKYYDPTGQPLLLVVPRHLRMEILSDLHDASTAGHLGFAKTYDRRRKGIPQLPPGYLKPIPPPDSPFQKVGIELLGENYLKERKKWIVVCTDYLTKYEVCSKSIATFEFSRVTRPRRCERRMCAGRPSTSTTDEKINEVGKMILANRRITVREVAVDLNISIGWCHLIFINDLGMRRVAAKFVPKLLNCDQKQHRMNIANEMLDSVRDDPNLIQRVITGDEPWVYGYDVKTKAQSSQWKLPHEPRPKKRAKGVVHHEFLPQVRTVNKEYYLQIMRNLREAIRQKRPDLWKNKNWLLHHDNAPAHTSLLVRDFLAKKQHTNDAAATPVIKAQETNKINYDARHKEKLYEPGDRIWIFIPIRRVGFSEKLQRRYFGPFKVTKKISDVTYEVEAVSEQGRKQKKRDTVHILRMKPYYDPSRQEELSSVDNSTSGEKE